MSGVEDIYTLSPMQHGMLFHILAGGEAELYLEQTVCTLHGKLNFEYFRRAWQLVVDLHPALRTRFAWKAISHPVQLVQVKAVLPVSCVDVRDLTPEQRDEQSRKLIEQCASESFDLERAPLMRLLLIRLSDDRHRLSCCCSHLIIDAWSLGLLLGQVFSTYGDLLRGDVPAAVQPPAYRGYVVWQATLPKAPALAFWREYLRGVASPTPLPTPDGGGEGMLSRRWRWEQAESEALYVRLRARGVTLGSFAQAAWALQLSEWSGHREVLFGLVHSGRHPDLPGVESMVGPLLNTLPTLVRLDPDVSVRDWLWDIQCRHVDMGTHAAASLVEVSRCCGIPPDSPMFESVVVVLNAVRLEHAVGKGFIVDDIEASGHSNYPVLVRLYPGSSLEVELLLRADRYSEAFADSAMASFNRLLRRLAHDLDAPRVHVLGTPGGAKRVLPQLSKRVDAPLRVTRQSLLSIRPLSEQASSPLLVEPRNEALEASSWARGNGGLLRSLLAEHGALLLRGFEVDSVEAFEEVSLAVAGHLIDYQERSTPRTKLQGKVYTSTEYPASEPIALHNEFSYGVRWPMAIMFHCVMPAAVGGETPIADCRAILQSMDPDMVERFTKHGVMYVRNYGMGVDLTWQEAFQTDEPAVVEKYCRDVGIEFEWRGGGRLRTRQVRQAVAVHPRLGTQVWFNQAHLFHVSNLRQAVRQGLLDGLKEEDLPRDARFGDGSRISTVDLRKIQEAYRGAEIVFVWRRADILILDNMRYAHGRRPFSGERRVAVCMGNLHDATA